MSLSSSRPFSSTPVKPRSLNVEPKIDSTVIPIGGGKIQDAKRLLCTFYVQKQLYGIDVMQVQEVVRFLPMSRIPMAFDYVRGLINLRGQVATAIGLREMFAIRGETPGEPMNVILKHEGALIALQVDEIGDVMEVERRGI